LSSANTTYGDTWNCSITPYDGTDYGTTNSDKVFINNTAPPKVNLSYPPKSDAFFSDRTPVFNWTSITDPDGDSITYHIQIANDYEFSSIVYKNGTVAQNYYNYTTELSLSTQYFWRVLANDSINESPWSDIWNFTIQPYVAVALFNASMNFATMDRLETNDTTDNSPPPIKLQNDGNTECNVSVYATQLWQTEGLGKEYFQFKANETAETGSFNTSGSQMTWANMTAGNSSLIKTLNHSDINDEAFVDILVKVPGYEPPTARSSLVTFYSEEDS
jgi:hypothetical protein